MNEDVLRDYKVEGQITLEEYLWSVGHYIAIPVEEESGECKMFYSMEANEYYEKYMQKIKIRTSCFEDLFHEIYSEYAKSEENCEFDAAFEILSNELAKRESEVTGSAISYFAP